MDRNFELFTTHYHTIIVCKQKVWIFLKHLCWYITVSWRALVVSQLKISFNTLSLVACDNENKACFFDLFFLHISPIVSILGWFLYFIITLRIGSETFSNKKSLWGLHSGILRFLYNV